MLPISSLRVSKNFLKKSTIAPVFVRFCGERWFDHTKKKHGKDYALEHFDSYYSRVYQDKWSSIRIALHWENKYCAVVNPFITDPDEVYAGFANQGCYELSNFYNKHFKYIKRHRLRMQILEEKKEKKIAALAEKRGIKPEEIESDIEVSDVSDSELNGAVSSFSDPENIVEMFETDIEAMRNKDGFIESNMLNIDLNDFMPSTELKYAEESPLNQDNYFRFYDADIEVPVDKVEVERLEVPERPKVFMYPRGSLNSFESPSTKAKNGVLPYCLIDAASILPVITLNIQSKDRVVDLCASSGEKAIAMLFTLKPAFLLACEPATNKFSRLQEMFRAFIPKIDGLSDHYHLEQASAQEMNLESAFDKVLINAPSTNDRISVLDNYNNIFKPSQASTRVNIPEKQKSILTQGLKLVKPGGSVVYSTCSLSPIQNDGVVHMSLHAATSEGMKFTVDKLKEAYRPLRGLYRFHTFKYGIQVLPYLPVNCGPMYISKINRIE